MSQSSCYLDFDSNKKKIHGFQFCIIKALLFVASILAYCVFGGVCLGGHSVGGAIDDWAFAVLM